MNKIVLAFLIASTFILFSPSMTLSFEGLLLVKNQFPLFLHINSPYLESAATGNSFSVSLSHSSVFMIKNSASWSINLDMELTELALRYRKDIPGLFELGIDVPVLSFTSGFMDNFLSSYHQTFGFPDYGRSSRPKNKFLYEVKKNGKVVIRGENGRVGIGDIRLTAKKALLKSDPAISIRAETELPTGDAKHGFGSGSFDAGAGVLIDKQLSEKLKSYCNFGIVFPGGLKGYETIKLKGFIYAGAGVEVVPWKNLGFIGQIFFQGSPFPKTDIGTIDRIAALLSLGGRYSSGNNSLELSFTEDPNTAGAPDFILNFSFKKIF